MTLTDAQLMAWLGAFVWPLMRMSGLVVTAPILGSRMVPTRIRILVALVVAAVMAMTLPHLPPFPAHIGQVMWLAASNVLYGAILGFVMTIAVSAITVAGEMMGISMGLSFARLSAPANGTPIPVMSDILLWAGLMAYIATGGPLWLLAAVYHSFALHPAAAIATGSWHAIALAGAGLFREGLWLALPVVIAGLAVNTVLGVVTSFAPSLNIFSVGFPLLYLVGIWALMLVSGDIQQIFGHAFQHSLGLLGQLV